MDEVEEIKQRLEVAEVVGGYIPLKQAGRNLKAPCPFHHEKTASFMVSPEKGIWHCFGCGEGGDIFKFVMKMEGLDFRQALELLAPRAGVELKNRGSGEGGKQKDRLYRANDWAVKYYQASLIKNPKALEYVIRQRRLKKQTIKDFQIGYAPDNWNALTGFLVKKGFTAAELLRAGLAGQKEGRTTIYDMFRGRVIFTICDQQGRPIGFTGRVLDDSLPKYLNTPQSPLYDKSRAIFGLHLAKNAIREADEAVLVEGNMDVVASHQAGVGQVVAASGTALTLDQLKTLGRLTKNIKLAFDQDAAGLAATERAIELAQKLGLTLKIVDIGEAKDPDELISADPAVWKRSIAQAKYVIDYLFERFEKDYDLSSAMGKRQYSDRLAWNLKRLGDPVEQDHYVQLLSQKLSSSVDSVRRKVETATAPSGPVITRSAAVTAPPPKSEKPKPSPAWERLESSVLALNLAHPEVRLSLQDLKPSDFRLETHQQIFELLRQSGKQPADQIAKALSEHSDYVKILTLKGEQDYDDLAPADRSFEAFTLVRRLQATASDLTKKQLSQRLKEAEAAGDAGEVRTLLEKYQALMTEDL